MDGKKQSRKSTLNRFTVGVLVTIGVGVSIEATTIGAGTEHPYTQHKTLISILRG